MNDEHVPQPPTPELAIRVFFAALFCFALASLLIKALVPSLTTDATTTAPSSAVAAGDIMSWEMEGRLLLGLNGLGRAEGLAKQLREGFDDSTFGSRRRLILAGRLASDEQWRPAAIRDTITTETTAAERRELVRVIGTEAVRLATDKRQSEFEQQANAAIITLYRGAPPSPLRGDELTSVTQSLGWFGRVVEADHWLLVDPEEGRQRVEALTRDAIASAIKVAAVFAIAFAGIIAGAALLITFITRATNGRIRWRGVAITPAQWLAFETFTLYLTGFALTQAWLLFAPFVAFWPLLRGARRQDIARMIGLSRGEGLRREALSGFAGYLAAAPVMILALFVATALSKLAEQSIAEAAHPLAPEVINAPSFLVVFPLFLLAVIYAPLVEELFFRGFFYGWLRGGLGPVISVILSALLFAAIHPQGLLGLPILFTIGAALAILREWRQSLIAPIIAHACVNGITMSVLMAL